MKKVTIKKALANLIEDIRGDWAPIYSKFNQKDELDKVVMEKILVQCFKDVDIITLARAIQEGYEVRDYITIFEVMALNEGSVVEHDSEFYSDTNFVVEFDMSDGGKYLTFGDKSMSDGAILPFTETMLIPKWYVVKEA